MLFNLVVKLFNIQYASSSARYLNHCSKSRNTLNVLFLSCDSARIGWRQIRGLGNKDDVWSSVQCCGIGQGRGQVAALPLHLAVQRVHDRTAVHRWKVCSIGKKVPKQYRKSSVFFMNNTLKNKFNDLEKESVLSSKREEKSISTSCSPAREI